MWCKWYIYIYISTKTRIINLRLHESLWMEQNQVLPSILLQLTCPPLEELSISKFQMPGCSHQWLTTGGVTKNCSASLGRWDCMSYQLKLVPKHPATTEPYASLTNPQAFSPAGFFNSTAAATRDERRVFVCLSRADRVLKGFLWMEKCNPTDSIKRDTVLREILTWETCDMYMREFSLVQALEVLLVLVLSSISSTSICRTASGTNANSATTHQHDRGSYCNYWVGGSD